MLGASATLVEVAGDFKRPFEAKFAFCDEFLFAPERGSSQFALSSSRTHFAGRPSVTILPVHLRPPSIDQGVQAFLWALGLGLFIWLGLLAIGVSGATSFILAAVAGGLIFLYVRIFGEEDLRR